MGGEKKQTRLQLGILAAALDLIERHPLVVDGDRVDPKDKSRKPITYTDLYVYVREADLDGKLLAGSTGLGGEHAVGSHDSVTGTIMIDLEKSGPDPRRIAATMLHEGGHGLKLPHDLIRSAERIFFELFKRPQKQPSGEKR